MEIIEYQLDMWQTLEAMYSAGNIIGTTFLVFIQIILPVLALLIKIPYRIGNRLFKGMIIAIFILVNGLSFFQIWGSGWKIDKSDLQLKVYFFSDNIHIPSMKIGFVREDSEWKPSWREPGTGLPKLSVGRYQLANKEKALVINHYRQNKLLLILAGEKYYLIGHPGIEELYNELVRLGAKEENFDLNEVNQ